MRTHLSMEKDAPVPRVVCGPDTFFADRSWADCITSMSGLDLRQAHLRAFPQKLVAFVALVVTPAGRYLFEGLARVGENNGSARFRLIASDNDIDVEWIEFDAAAHPPGILGGDESRPGAEEGVENNLATVRQVDQRILQHCGWFHSRMIL